MVDQNNDELYAMRHSLAHIMATAITIIWPEAKLGVGPVVEDGFYYDIDIPGVTISTDDFKQIEKQMYKVINKDQKFEKSEKPIDEALEWAKAAKQPYKEELLNDLKREGTTLASELEESLMGLPLLPTGVTGISKPKVGVADVSFYTNGEFTDLCRGPHVESTGKVGAFKLMRVAGAYWRGKEENPQMQRLYGVAFATKEELNTHLQMLEEAKKRDHRKLGKELDLFIFSDLVGSGLPLYTPRGTTIRNGLIAYSEEIREKLGFERVWSPHITKKDLYVTSGHWDKFGDELFLVKSQETSDELVMKPMNCPHHAQIYAAKPRSYRDLPVKLMETATNYRDEKTGELHGLSRVRSLTQDDSHTYCRPDQVDEIFSQLIVKIQEFYHSIDMNLSLRLSFRDDSDSYLGPQELWEFGQNKLTEIAKNNNLDFYTEEGEAAFYGPKLDFMAEDAIGRKWQVATIQFDFVQPERFELEYTDEKGEKQRPIMVHCAVMGSFDRFFSVYIEHTAGKFPIWLAPEQLRLIQVKDSPELDSFVDEIATFARENKIRIQVDRSNESVGKKIRNSELMKIPYTVVVGEKELETKELSPRVRSDLTSDTRRDASYPLNNFIKTIVNEVKGRVQKSSL